MKFLSSINRDLLVLGAGLTIIAACSALLYADLNRRVEISGAKKIGTISYKRKVAQRKYASQVLWEDVDQSAPVYDSDSIRTADLSEAVITLADGTSIDLDENSLILLSLAGRRINIDFSHGTIYASRGEALEGAPDSVEIRSMDAVVSVGKGEVKLSRTGDKEMNITVTEGSAEIKTPEGEKTITKDEKAVIAADAAPRVFQLKLALKTPLPNENIITASGAATVGFSWERAAGDYETTLEIAMDPGFTDEIAARRVQKDFIAEDLGEGSYYWRIRAVDPSTKEVDYSDTRRFHILHDDPIELIAPRNGETVTYVANPPMISFRWRKNRLASEYTVEISDSASFKTAVRSERTLLEDIAVDSLSEGSYYWRVKTRTAASASYSGASPVYRLNIKKSVLINPPVLLSPHDGRRVSTAMFNQGKDFIFSWSFNSQIKHYDLIISRDRDFKETVYRIGSGENFHALHKPLEPGTYFWRVVAATGAGEEAVSSANTLDVVQVGELSLNDPLVLASSAPAKAVYAKILFSWSKASVPAQYRFELSGDVGFLEIKKSDTLVDQRVAVDRLVPGVYFWRVGIVDTNGNTLLESMARPLYVSLDGVIVARAEDIQKPAPAAGKEKSEATGEMKGEAGGQEAVKEQPAKKEEQTAIGEEAGKMPGRIEKKEAGSVKTAAGTPKEEERLKGRRVEWKVNLASTVLSRPVFYDNMLLATTRSGFLVGISRRGARLWRINLGSSAQSTPAASGGVAYVVTVKGLLFAVSTADGSVKWTRPVEGPLLYGSAPILEKGRVYVATSYGVVQAFTPEGKEAWKQDLEEGIFSPMAYAKGILYVGTDGSRVYALNADDGDVEWEFKTDSRVFYSSPMVYKGTLFVGCYSGTMYALRADSGRLRWKFSAKGAILSTPAFFNDAVYFGSESGMFYALGVGDGKRLWEFRTKARIVAGPDVFRKNILIPSGNTIYSVETGSGKLRWKEGFASGINTPVTVSGGSAFVGLDNGEVVSLRAY